MHMSVRSPWIQWAACAFMRHGNLVGTVCVLWCYSLGRKKSKAKKLELEITEATSPAQQGIPSARFLCCFLLLLCDFQFVFPVRWSSPQWLRFFITRSSCWARSVSREQGTSSLGQWVARHFWWWVTLSAALQRDTELLNCLFTPQFPWLMWGYSLSYLVIVDRRWGMQILWWPTSLKQDGEEGFVLA